MAVAVAVALLFSMVFSKVLLLRLLRDNLMLPLLLCAFTNEPTPLSMQIIVFSGTAGKPYVDTNIRHMYASAHEAGMELSVMLCVYDGSNWDDVEWTLTDWPGLDVVVIRAKRQMKYW